MSKRLVPYLLALGLTASACHKRKGPNPFKPDDPSFIFRDIPNQTVPEGEVLQLRLDSYASHPKGEPVYIRVTGGPGSIANTLNGNIASNGYSYRDAIDNDTLNNGHVVRVAASNWPGQPAFGPVETTFNITQIDNNPRRLTPRTQPMSSGLDFVVLGDTNGLTGRPRTQTAIAVNQNGPHIIHRDSEWNPTLAHQENGNWVNKPFGNSEGNYFSFDFDNQNVGNLLFDAGTSGQNLVHKTFTGGNWQTSNVVDSNQNVGFENNVYRDSEGHLHVSHFSSGDGRITYSTNKSGNWFNNRSLAAARWDQTGITTRDGMPHITYVQPDGRVAHLYQFVSGGWQNLSLQQGTNPVIKKGRGNDLHLIFNNNTLKHGYTSGGPWNFEDIPNSSHDSTQRLEAFYDPTDNNSLHVAHANNSGLFYSTNRRGSWQTFTLDNSIRHFNPGVTRGPDGKVYISSTTELGKVGFASFAPSFFTGN